MPRASHPAQAVSLALQDLCGKDRSRSHIPPCQAALEMLKIQSSCTQDQPARSGADIKSCSPRSPRVTQPPSSQQFSEIHCSSDGLSPQSPIIPAGSCCGVPMAVPKSPGLTHTHTQPHDSALLPEYCIPVTPLCPEAALRALQGGTSHREPHHPPSKTPCLGTGCFGAAVTPKKIRGKVVHAPCQGIPAPATTTCTAQDWSRCSRCC